MPDPTPPRPAATDLNLLFGVLALQMELIDTRQFADACAGWAAAQETPLGKLLVARGWITNGEKADLERLLQRKLKKHHGDARASLGAAADAAARQALEQVNAPAVRQALDGLLAAAGPELPPTELQVARHRYCLMRVHKEGGLGRVWLAQDGDLNREVALKEIKPHLRTTPETRQRFLKEAQIAGQLEHPTIVPVYELSRWAESGEPFYVMKFVRGQTLGAAIAEHHQARNGGPPDAPQRRRLLGSFVSVCNSIAYAHARGVIHRDLKPANVVLGKFGEVILLDWGLAKVLDGSLAEDGMVPVVITDEAQTGATSAGSRIGTPAYMAPEQADRRLDLVDRGTDVYGLGAILFELLTGRPPHEGTDTDEICRQIVHGETPRARTAEPAVPSALDEICARAMAKAKADRYASASELAEAVQRWLADEPLAAYRGVVGELERLAREQPGVPDYREQLARNRVNLGLVLAGMDRQGEAEETFRAAVSEYQALVAGHPAEPRYRAELAAARFQLSRALLALNRREEATEAQRAAIGDYEQLVAADPRAQEYHSNLASVLLTLAPGALQIEPLEPAEPSTADGMVDQKAEAPAPPAMAGDERLAEMRARLTLLQRYAVGGMSQIWVARDNDLNREVAIKEVLSAVPADPAVRQRFLREAQITAQLNDRA
jgi:serine/threonine protein kinase